MASPKMNKSKIPCVTFHNLEFSPKNFPKYNSYHEQVRQMFQKLNTVEKLTFCEPPLNYRLHRIKHMADNPRVIFAQYNDGNGTNIPASKLVPYFSPMPKITQESKGTVELLDSKRAPVILICPLDVSFKDANRKDIDNVLSDDQGYHSMPLKYKQDCLLDGHSSADVNLQEQVKSQVSLPLGCISDEEATSILFLIKSNSEVRDEEKSRLLVCKALKESYPLIYGNREDNPDVCFLNEKLPEVLDKMFQNVLIKQLMLLQTSVERIQKDFVAQAIPECPDSESHLDYILKTIRNLVVPEEQDLSKIAETVKHVKNNNSSRYSYLYSDYLGNQIVDHVIKDVFSYIDKEHSPMDKTLVSNAINKTRLQIPLGMTPHWIVLLTFVFTVFVLFMLVESNHLGFFEAIGLEALFIHLMVYMESSSINTRIVVSSVHRHLQNNVETIIDYIRAEHERSLKVLYHRKELVYKVQIQVRRLMRDIDPQHQRMDAGSRVNAQQLKEYLLSLPEVMGFGSMNGKLYIHAHETKVDDIKQQLKDIYKLECNEFVICPSSKGSTPQFYHNAKKAIRKEIMSKLGFFFRDCNGDVFFVIYSDIVPRYESVTIYDSNNARFTGKLKLRTDDLSINRMNFYSLTIFHIEETDIKIDTLQPHCCENKELHLNENTTGLIVESDLNCENANAQFLMISDKYNYKGSELRHSTWMEVSLAVPVGLEKTSDSFKPGLIKTKYYDKQTIVGLGIGILKSTPLQCDDKVDLGREELLAVIPYHKLLDFLHSICCESEEMGGYPY